MSARILGLLIVAMLLLGAGNEPLYRWVDSEGNVHYSDQPPPPNAKDIQEKKLSSKPGEPQIPYQLQRAVSNFPVSLYTTNCGEQCSGAAQLLSQRGIPHTVYDATQSSFQDELKKLTGGALVVPVLKIGSNVLQGFAPDQWNTALDAAGYPNTALMKVTPKEAKPPPPPAAIQKTEDGSESAS